jgi:hypothetical protein
MDEADLRLNQCIRKLRLYAHVAKVRAEVGSLSKGKKASNASQQKERSPRLAQ